MISTGKLPYALVHVDCDLTPRSWRWSQERYVAVKINAIRNPSRRISAENEVDIMRHLSQVNSRHHGWHFVRKLSDSFMLESTSGNHVCLVLGALREPLWLYRRRYMGGVIPPDILKILMQMILHALDYLHSECQIIHTGMVLLRSSNSVTEPGCPRAKYGSRLEA